MHRAAQRCTDSKRWAIVGRRAGRRVLCTLSADGRGTDDGWWRSRTWVKSKVCVCPSSGGRGRKKQTVRRLAERRRPSVHDRACQGRSSAAECGVEDARANQAPRRVAVTSRRVSGCCPFISHSSILQRCTVHSVRHGRGSGHLLPLGGSLRSPRAATRRCDLAPCALDLPWKLT